MYDTENVLPCFMILANGYVTVRALIREEWYVDSETDAWVSRSSTKFEITTVITNGHGYCEETETVIDVATTTRMTADATETDTFAVAISTTTISLDELEVTLFPEVIIIVANTTVERGNLLAPPAYLWPTVVDDDEAAEVDEEIGEPHNGEVLEVDFRSLGEIDYEDAPTVEWEIDWSRVPRL
jgi:hypothetical protein